MDRPTHHEPMLAPSANGGGVRAYAPGATEGATQGGDRGAGRAPSGRRSGAPALDDHLVKPEVTRDEIVRGERMVAMPSRPEHGDRHFGLDYVLGAHIRRNYVGSTDLITRFSGDSDFATDTCVRKTGTDPKTGERYLEEIAFEVVHTQSPKDIRVRAEDLTARGVRRFFAIFVKHSRVAEWSSSKGDFVTLAPDGEISDRTFATPVSVRALLDAAEADNGVARALLAKKNPVLVAIQEERLEEGLEKGLEKGREKGREEGLEEGLEKGREEGLEKGREEGLEKGREEGFLAGKASAVLGVLAARGLSATPALRRTIAACTDASKLDVWLARAATAASAADVVRDVPPARSRPRRRG